MSRQVFPTKFDSETLLLTFDFQADLAVGETLSGPTIAASVYSGTDASPSAIITGSATVSGATVTQKFTGGTVGNIYYVVCTVATSLSQVLQRSGFLTIVSDVT